MYEQKKNKPEQLYVFIYGLTASSLLLFHSSHFVKFTTHTAITLWGKRPGLMQFKTNLLERALIHSTFTFNMFCSGDWKPVGDNVWITFFLLGHDRRLGLFCVRHSFTWREVHLYDFGHSQFWSRSPKIKQIFTLHEIGRDYIPTEKKRILTSLCLWATKVNGSNGLCKLCFFSDHPCMQPTL